MESVAAARSRMAYGVVFGLVMVGLYLTSLHSYLLFHSLAEIFSVVVAFSVFTIAWNSRRFVENPYLLFVGIAYLFVGLLDLLHTLSYKGMAIFTDYDYYANQLWIASRYLESTALLLAFAYIIGRTRPSPDRLLALFSAVTALLIASIFWWKTFPVCFVEGKGLTPFKVYSEYVICVLLGVSLALLYVKRDAFEPRVFRCLAWSIVFTIASELSFTRYISNYGFSSLVGHYFKIFAFLYVYAAVVRTSLLNPNELIFRELNEANQRLNREAAARAEAEGRLLVAHDEAQAERHLLEAVMAALPVGVAITDAQGGNIRCNATFEAIWGAPRPPALTVDDYRAYKAWWSDDGRPVRPDEWASALAVREGRTVVGQRLEIERFDGTRAQVINSASPVRDVSGNVVGSAVAVQDVTDLYRAEAAVREKAATLRGILDATQESIWLFDADGTILLANDTAIARMGRPADEILGRHFRDVLPEDLAATRGTYHSRVVETGQALAFEDERSGICFAHNFYPVKDEAGRVVRLVSFSRDITERRRQETALLEAKEAAERANRAKSDFLAMMSHEIRTPMNGVLGMTELALLEDVPPKASTYLGLVKRSAQWLLDIINDILDLSKVEAGKRELQEEDFDLREALDTVTCTLEVLAAEKGLSLGASVAGDVPALVRGDRGMLSQVVTNLVGNAIKFTKQGSVSVSVVLADGQPAPEGRGRLRVEVRDTGVGIPREKLDQIFEAFAQAGGGSYHARYGGTGLGLTICRQLVRLLGGELEVSSEVGRGSVFGFTAELGFPVERELAPAEPRKGSPTTGASPLRILLAEDNEINQLVGKGLLERDGHAVTVAGNGLLALEALGREPFDVVLMDVQMPELDGLEATRRIRAGAVAGVDPKIPIVALTAHALRGDRERILAAGVDDYIPKPVDPEELYRVLRNR